MSPTDARMAFERHATSKLREIEDLDRLSTMGFRGEALAAIASVCQVELRTRIAELEVGTELRIEGARVKSSVPVACPVGTTLRAMNIFYNTPGRRKHIEARKESTELGDIWKEFAKVALANPEVSFALRGTGKYDKALPASSLKERIIGIGGSKLSKALIPVNYESSFCSIRGFIGTPATALKSGAQQYFFVNNRFIRHPYFHKAVMLAYEKFIPVGTQPHYFLYFTIPAGNIDVNIHPQKTEVKFEDEHLIYALIRSTVKRSLGIYNIAPSLDFDRDPQKDIFAGISSKVNTSSQFTDIKVDRNYNPFQSEKMTDVKMVNLGEMYQPNIQAEPSKLNALFEDDDFDEELMRLPNGYWLYNRGDKTLMLNMERIYALVLADKKKQVPKEKAGQTLLFSLEYHLNEMEKIKYTSIKKYLPELGFDIVLDRDNVLKISAIPVGLNETKVMEFLERIFEILDYKTEEDFMNHYEEQWIKVQTRFSCNFLYKTDVEELIKEYIQIGFSQYLPDGRRCYLELPLEELKNKF